MAEITASMVKELRQRTQAGMMDCKKYLTKTSGDIEKAVEIMRKEGALKAAKKAGRIAAEGVVAVIAEGNKVAIVEVNCETDFVGRGDDFKQFADKVAAVAIANGSKNADSLKQLAFNQELTVQQAQENLIAKLGENINVRRAMVIEKANDEIIGCYSHGGRIAAVVKIKGGNDDLAKDVAMHIAASKPEVINPEDVNADVVAKEKQIYMHQAEKSGKPANIIEKIVEGQVNKFLNEISLVGQPFVKQPDLTVGKLLAQSKAQVVEFVRYEVGEGIEKKQVDFAAEVQQQMQGN